MADTLVSHLARALHLPPDAARQTLHHLVSTLREQLDATGEAAVPGLGTFRQTDGRLAFEPEEALVRAVNHRYAGLTVLGAAPAKRPPAPAAPVAEAPTGFKPLPSFLDEQPDEEAEVALEVEEETEAKAVPEAAAAEPEPDAAPTETPPAEAAAPPLPEDPAPIAHEDPVAHEEGAFVSEEVEEENHALDALLAGTWTEETDASEDAALPLAPVPEEPVDEADYALVEPEAADKLRPEDDKRAAVPMPVAAPPVDRAEEPGVPVVAAPRVAASAPPRRPAARPRWVPLVAGLAVAALLVLALLLWTRSREPEPVAERPPAADTAAAALPPADTLAAEPLPPAAPPEPSESPDPLRSTAGVDPAEGGFTWVVASELNREAAERQVARYREQGLRAGVVAEEARGRTRYRVSLGQFASFEEAETRRADLPPDVPPDIWILRL